MHDACFDVVVIGAGPAGSVAARNVAKAGYSVALFEKRQEIGTPVRCGEGVSAKWLIKHTEVQDRWISTVIKGAWFRSPDMTTAEMLYKEPEYIIDRKLFDYDLACDAARAGVHVATKASVTAITRQDDGFVCMINGLKSFHVYATLLIVADGVESRIAPMLGINTTLTPKDLGVCFQYTIENADIEEDHIEVIGGREFAPGGYAWIFPKGNRTANVGMGMPASFSTKDMNACFYVEQLVAKRFPKASVVRTVSGAVPLSLPLKEMYGDGFLIAGDAARLSNPLTGAGIGNALESGALAASTAVRALKKGDVRKNELREYQDEVMKSVGTSTARFYSLKEGYVKFTDENFNTLVRIIRAIAPGKVTPKVILETAFRENLGLLKILKSVLLS